MRTPNWGQARADVNETQVLTSRNEINRPVLYRSGSGTIERALGLSSPRYAALCAVPELTRSDSIKLNRRLSFFFSERRYRQSTGHRPPSCPVQQGQSRQAIMFRLAALFLYGIADRMPTLLEKLRPQRDVERRGIGRTLINRSALMHFAGWVHDCCVRDVINLGAGIRLNGLKIIPSVFNISFDNFRTMRSCLLIWRDGDFGGAAFDS
jgi:hypothetical protein